MKKHSEASRWQALVMAGDRRPDDPLLIAQDSTCKALIPVAGVTMLERVLAALAASDCIERTMLVGPSAAALASSADLQRRIDDGEPGWLAPATSPTESALAGLAALQSAGPVLVTTADHALLSAEIVQYFIAEANRVEADFVVAVARLDTVMAGFPGTRRTAIRLQDGPFCGCNLFAVCTPRGAELIAFWRRVEQQRKKPWRVIAGALGVSGVLRYLCGRLTLQQALQRLARQQGLRLAAVVLPFAEAAVDVDTLGDLALVEATLDKGAEKGAAAAAR